MAMRLSGLMSGMDTESVIEQLVMARRTKVDDVKKAQTKLQWKTDAWKTLNSKILKLYNGILGSTMRFEGSYMKKVTKVSNSSVVNVITGDNAMNSVQSLKVKKMANSAYLTGGEVGFGENKGKLNLDSNSRLTQLGGGWTFADWGKINVTVGDKQTEINVSGATTIGELVQSFKDAGLNASFDTVNQRFYITSKGTGKDSDFTITAGDRGGMAMLEDLGLSYVKSDYYNNVVDTYYKGKLDSRLNELVKEQEMYQGWKNNLLTDMTTGKYSELFEGMDDKADLGEVKKKVGELLARGGLSEDAEKDLRDWQQNVADTETKLSGLDDKLQMVDGKWELTDGEKDSVMEQAEIEMPKEVKSAREVSELLEELGDRYTYSGQKTAGEDAVIELNGVEYTSSKNTFEINGLTLTVNATTGENEVVTLTTQDDTDGIYDMIKSFFKEYNELINEMDKLYNADSSKGYEPLTSEEKEAMSESEVEEWEKKIKDSLLRKDNTLGTLSNALKQLMLEGVNVNGKKMYLSNFGIETLSYFTAPENEKNAYHIDGDSDDPNTASNEDKLRAMIATDPQTVIDFFVGLSRNMYAEMTTRMARTEYSSAYTAYEDVRMKKEYDDYTSKIKELEKKLSDYEDKWYQKFAQMETALAKLQSSASAVTSLLGG